jgi:3-methyladenine DNA glycosylase Tag
LIPFAPIHQRALERIGDAALGARLPTVLDSAALAAVPDDRYLSMMSLRVFQAGLRHSVVAAKWPAFEAVFFEFQPRAIMAMHDEDLEALMEDRRLIRHGGKLRAVRDNAAALMVISDAAGGFGRWLGAWPGERLDALWTEIGARFSQMGGDSAARFLRMAGKDTYILSHSVAVALYHWGVLDTEPKGRAARAKAQAQFNDWAVETGLPLAHLSMILAASVDD